MHLAGRSKTKTKYVQSQRMLFFRKSQMMQIVTRGNKYGLLIHNLTQEKFTNDLQPALAGWEMVSLSGSLLINKNAVS